VSELQATIRSTYDELESWRVDKTEVVYGPPVLMKGLVSPTVSPTPSTEAKEKESVVQETKQQQEVEHMPNHDPVQHEKGLSKKLVHEKSARHSVTEHMYVVVLELGHIVDCGIFHFCC